MPRNEYKRHSHRFPFVTRYKWTRTMISVDLHRKFGFESEKNTPGTWARSAIFYVNNSALALKAPKGRG